LSKSLSESFLHETAALLSQRESISSHSILLFSSFMVGLAIYGLQTYQSLTIIDLIKPSLIWLPYWGVCACVFYIGWIGFGWILNRFSNAGLEEILKYDALSYLPLVLAIGVWLKHFYLPATIAVIPAISGMIAIKAALLWKIGLMPNPRISIRFVYIFLGAVTLAYTIGFSIMGWLRYMAFQSFGELGMFAHQLWGFSQLKMLMNTTVRGISFFGDHVSPILVLLVPFNWLTGWIWGSATTLLVIQSMAFAIGAIPIYLLAQDRLLSTKLSLIFVILYLLYPAVQFPNLGDFHESLLIPPFSLFAFYYLQRKSYKLMWPFVILALMCKEDVTIIVFMLGVYTWVILRSRTVGVGLISIAVIWFILCVGVIVPYFREGQDYGYFVEFLQSNTTNQSSFSDMFVRLSSKFLSSFTLVEGVYVIQMLLPLGFLSLLAPAELLIGIPTILELMLYTGPPHGMVASIYSWHNAAVVPWFFISGIYGTARLIKWWSESSSTICWRTPLGVGIAIYLIFTGILSNVTYGALPYSTTFKFTDYTVTPHDRIGHDLLKLIPDEASVSTTTHILSTLAERELLYVFPEPYIRVLWLSEIPLPAPADYVMIDTSRAVMAEISDSSQAAVKERVRAIGRRPDYQTLIARDGYVIFKRVETLLLD